MKLIRSKKCKLRENCQLHIIEKIMKQNFAKICCLENLKEKSGWGGIILEGVDVNSFLHCLDQVDTHATSYIILHPK